MLLYIALDIIFETECKTIWKLFQTHYSTFEYFFEFIIFVQLSSFFSTLDKCKSLEEQRIYSKLSQPFWKTKNHLCDSITLLFLVFWISFPCLYLNNSCLIVHSIVWSAKSSSYYMIENIFCFKLFSTS